MDKERGLGVKDSQIMKAATLYESFKVEQHVPLIQLLTVFG